MWVGIFLGIAPGPLPSTPCIQGPRFDNFSNRLNERDIQILIHRCTEIGIIGILLLLSLLLQKIVIDFQLHKTRTKVLAKNPRIGPCTGSTQWRHPKSQNLKLSACRTQHVLALGWISYRINLLASNL